MKKKRSIRKKKYFRNKSTKRVRRGGGIYSSDEYNEPIAGVKPVDVLIDRTKMIDGYKKQLAADPSKKNELRTKMVQDGFTVEETVPVLGKYWGDKEWKKLSPMMIQSLFYKADRGEIRLFSKKDAIQNLFFAIAHRFFNDNSIIYLRSTHFSDWYSDGKIPTVEDEINYCITNKINCINTLHPKFGITPLHLAIIINRISTILDLEKSIYSSNWTGKNIGDKTEILLTVEESDEEDKKTVEYLINNGADIDAVDNYGNTPLIYALWREKQPKPITAKYLIEKGAKINKCNWFKTTPIMFAVLFSTPEIVQLMIDKGADVKAIDLYGTSVLDYANRKINKDFAAIIQRSIDKQSAAPTEN